MKERSSQQLFLSRLLFVLVTSLLLGLLQSVNFLLIFIIGYGAIYTSIITLLVSMYVLIKMYEYYFEVDMNFKNGVLLSIPIFILKSILNFFLVDYDFDGTVTYEYYANGYFSYLVEESAKQFVPSILFFLIVFFPLYRFLKRKKELNNDKRTGVKIVV